VFINIPAIAKYEWHPFTLSSAPEDSDHITLHIRAVGQWTNRLLNFFEKEQERLHNGEVLPYHEQVHENPNGKMMEMQMMLKESKCEKVNERSDGKNMKQNMIMASEIIGAHVTKNPMEKSLSMPDMKTKERIRK
jgi:NADPH oxidase 5